MIDIETGSANVYAYLGRADAEEMLAKAQLASKTGEILKRRKLTQEQAAEILGIPQPELSGMLCGQFRGISEAKMMDRLAKLGREVRIVVGPARGAAAGSVKVAFGCDIAGTSRASRVGLASALLPAFQSADGEWRSGGGIPELR
jgi:predicted XRE-type DNA-binding protein